MPTLDINGLVNDMVSAAKTSLGTSWPAMDSLAVSSFKTLAQTFINIQTMQAQGTITPEKAGLLFDMQKNAIQTVLLTEEGLGLLAVQNAINAALNTVSAVVDKAIGIALL
jgi:hypothetical protein